MRSVAGSRLGLIRLAAVVVLAVAAGIPYPSAGAEDWPTYRHDNSRSAVTPERLAPPLAQQWVFRAPYPPEPAWPDPAKEKGRVQFDEVYHVAVADGSVYFGSSADGKVYCLDAATGQVRWTALTDGPIHVAPAVRNRRVYVGSDDGCAYCLDAIDGRLVWKTRAAYSPREVLGNGRMISLWPIRTGVLIDGDVAYFGAGVFPSESIFICAAKADDGTVLWRNDTCGEKGYTMQYGGISPQGPLLASASTLFVPSGRAVPAAFDQQTGAYRYYLRPNAQGGGAWALLTDDELLTGAEFKQSYDPANGNLDLGGAYAWSGGFDLVVANDVAYMLGSSGLAALDRRAFATAAEQRTQVRAERKEIESRREELWRKAKSLPAEEREAASSEMAATGKRIEELYQQEGQVAASIRRWRRECACQNALILAGDCLYLGGDGAVAAAMATTGQDLWSATVDGRACGLAVSDGRLFVSTTTGRIYCYAAGGPAPAGDGAPASREVAVTFNPVPYARDDRASAIAQAAERIVSATGVTKGYCLVYGSGSGRLIHELAQRTDLAFVGIDSDAGNVEAARKALDSAGLYGKRATIVQGDLAHLPFADYFANVIVSESALANGAPVGSLDEALRCLKPCGGVAYLNVPLSAWGDTELANGLAAENLASQDDGGWLKVVRGPIPGAGKWTHEYADTANTACSDDQAVKAPIGVLWFGNPGPEHMVDRHARVTAPVAMDGRMFVEGENAVTAYDSYNGILLWRRDIPGVVRVRVDADMGNLALERDGLYVAVGDQCLRLDPATGETLKTYAVPGPSDARKRWGYIACIGHTLFGTRARPFDAPYGTAWWQVKTAQPGAVPSNEEAAAALAEPRPTNPLDFWGIQQSGDMWRGMTDFPDGGRVETPLGSRTSNIMASDLFFAIDTESGETKWSCDAGAISHPAIAIGDGTVFLADCGVTAEQKQAAMAERNALIQQGVWEDDGIAYTPGDADVRHLVALDAATGDKRWERVVDLSGCGGDRLGLAYKDGVLCALGCFSNHDRAFFLQGQLKWRRVTALNAGDGRDLWSKPLNYLRRPLILGDSLLVEPRACDLRTGAIRTRRHPLTGQESTWEFVRPGHCCAITSACPNMFFLRGDFLWYYDVARDQGMMPFGGIRPGCWINTVPANGLVLFPEASAGCTCCFPVTSTVAFAPQNEQKTWSIFIQHGALKPVTHMAVSFGAPGDRRDDAGTLWVSYPHIRSNGWFQYGLAFPLDEQFMGEPRYFARNLQAVETKNTDKPWLFASGCKGLKTCTLPLLDEGQGPGLYTVRLYFADHENSEPGTRVFTVKLQDKTVLKNFDIARAAGGRDAAVVREFNGIKADTGLKVELIPKAKNPDDSQLPLINAIEAIREDGVSG